MICAATGNYVGQDIWEPGKPCYCVNCALFRWQQFSKEDRNAKIGYLNLMADPIRSLAGRILQMAANGELGRKKTALDDMVEAVENQVFYGDKDESD